VVNLETYKLILTSLYEHERRLDVQRTFLGLRNVQRLRKDVIVCVQMVHIV